MERKERKKMRIAGCDYSSPGIYYVTICTKKRRPCFGKIKNGTVVLNKLGKIAHRCWLAITNHFKNVELDELVIMPDHMHGIVVIKNDPNIDHTNRGQACLAPIRVGTQYQKLPVIIGSFKSSVTRIINANADMPLFQWQRSYWCEIVNDEYRLKEIREYIRNNPREWEIDQIQKYSKK